MFVRFRTKMKSLGVLIEKTFEDMDEFELCLFACMSIYNAKNIGQYFGGKYPELGSHVKVWLHQALMLITEMFDVIGF